MAQSIVRTIALMSAACLTVVAAPVVAQTVAPSAAGTYSSTEANGSGGSGTPTGNFVTGSSAGETYRGYLIYNIPAGTAFTSATLRLNAAVIDAGPNTVNVYDVSTAPSMIAAGTATPGTTYSDLGTGVVFGTAVASMNNQTLTIPLSADAIAAINAARGSSIAFGLNNETVTTSPDFVFGTSLSSSPRDLILVRPAPVPTMTEWAMILFGVILVGGAALYVQRRKQLV